MGHDIRMPAAFLAVQKQQVLDWVPDAAGEGPGDDAAPGTAAALIEAPARTRDTFVFDETVTGLNGTWAERTSIVSGRKAGLQTVPVSEMPMNGELISQATSNAPSTAESTVVPTVRSRESPSAESDLPDMQALGIGQQPSPSATATNDHATTTIPKINTSISATPPSIDDESLRSEQRETTATTSTVATSITAGTGTPRNTSQQHIDLPTTAAAAAAGEPRPGPQSSWTSTSSFRGGIDRYGFKKQSTYISEETYNQWYAEYEKYCTRRKVKWVKLLQESGLGKPSKDAAPVRFPPQSQKLKRYVRKGIPAEWRGNAWWYYAHGQDRMNSHPGLYKNLVEQSRDLKNSDTEHIERDLHRTFPDNIHFRNDPATNQEAPQLTSLRRVLTAFSVYQPKIGYCQSLNFIAGNLLLFLDEERAFWMLVIITQNYLTGLHEENLEQVNISQGILMISVRDRLPKIWHALGLEQVYEDNFITNLPPVSLCTASWFMSMMVNVLPTETMMRVWDCFFVEGTKVLYRIALTLFKLVEPTISRTSDEIEVFQAIQTIPRQLIDPAVLMGTCFKRANGFGHLSADDIIALRKFVQERRRTVLDQSGRVSTPSTTDRDEYAKFHPGRRLRAKLSLYK